MDSLAKAKPSCKQQSRAVAIAIAALAQTTCRCASVPFPSKTFVKIVAAAFTESPPPICDASSLSMPKLAALTVVIPWFETTLVSPVSETSS